MLVVPTDFCEDTGILEMFLPTVIANEKEKLIRFLTAIDSGIKDVVYEDGEKEPRFFTIHKGKGGGDYMLNLFLESEGTLKSIML